VTELPRIVSVDVEPKHVTSTTGVAWFRYRVRVTFDREMPIDGKLHYVFMVNSSVITSGWVNVPRGVKEVVFSGVTPTFTIPLTECTPKTPLVEVCRGVKDVRVGFCLTAKVNGVATQPPTCLAGYARFAFFKGPRVEVSVERFRRVEERRVEKRERNVPQKKFKEVVEEMRRSVEESLPPQIREKVREALCVLSGVVVDVVEEKPVQGAEVILTDKTTYRVHTDSNGRFTIANIEPGRYKLIIRAKNYVTWVREVELRSGDYLELTIAMEPLKPRVRDVVATATITATPLLLAFISALAKKW